MYARLRRVGKIVPVVLAISFIAALIAVSRTDGVILFRVLGTVYDSNEEVEGALINLSRHAIDIRSPRPLLYGLTGLGWVPPFPYTMVSHPQSQKIGPVQSGRILPIHGTFIVDPVEMEWKWLLLEEYYFYDEDEYVVYSNRFVITQTRQLPIFRSPPPGLEETVIIRTDVLDPYTVLLTNNWKQAIWFNPLCSAISFDDYTGEHRFATLQRQTNEGTWQVIPPDRLRCEMDDQPIRIGPGEAVQLSLRDGYPVSNSLGSGVYRWHLVYYIDPFPLFCDVWCAAGGIHLFTQAFRQ